MLPDAETEQPEDPREGRFDFLLGYAAGFLSALTLVSAGIGLWFAFNK